MLIPQTDFPVRNRSRQLRSAPSLCS